MMPIVIRNLIGTLVICGFWDWLLYFSPLKSKFHKFDFKTISNSFLFHFFKSGKVQNKQRLSIKTPDFARCNIYLVCFFLGISYWNMVMSCMVHGMDIIWIRWQCDEKCIHRVIRILVASTSFSPHSPDYTSMANNTFPRNILWTVIIK